MVVENKAGDVGTVLWTKTKHGLAYGYAGTTHLAQGITSDQHIHAHLDGTRSADAFSTYVGMSRHRDQATLVLNEAAIRREIHKTRVAGTFEPISQAEIWRKAADDMSHKPQRDGALAMLSRVSDIRRGDTASFHKVAETQEKRGVSHFQGLRFTQAVDREQLRQRQAQELRQRQALHQRQAQEHQRYAHTQSRGYGMSR